MKTPLLSAANWGGQPLHPRGNFEGFMRAAAKDKWLEAHGIEHWTHFYTDYGRKLQLRFFDHFLHGRRDIADRCFGRRAADENLGSRTCIDRSFAHAAKRETNIGAFIALT